MKSSLTFGQRGFFSSEEIVFLNRSSPFKKRKLVFFVVSTNDGRVDITFSRQGLTEAERKGMVDKVTANEERW